VLMSAIQVLKNGENKQMDHCQQRAQACRICAEECRKMAR
jgi:hypothetical protein